MASANLRTMNVKQLLSYREEIDRILSQKQRELEQELAELQRLSMAREGRGSGRGARGARSHPLKGAKIPPKYVDPKDPKNRWAGRGARPLWLTAALKNGAKLEDFAVSSAAAESKASPVKRSGRGRKKKS